MTSLLNCVFSVAVILAATCFDLSSSSGGNRFQREISTQTTTDSRIVFPGSGVVRFPDSPKSSSTVASSSRSNSSLIPVSLFLKNSVENTNDFVDLLSNKDELKSGIPVSHDGPNNLTIFMRANSGVRTNEVAEMAHCMPTLTAVDLERSSDPAVIYFPSCTRVERCGGCCMHDLLACEPTKIENVRVKVMVARYDPDNEAFRHEGLKSLELQKHLGCECRCRVKATDCNVLQDYHPNECKCICRNDDEIVHCSGEKKFWDPRSCTCLCRTTKECSTGFYFDSTTCSCEPEGRAAPVFRVPTGVRLPWKNREFSYEASWDSDRRAKRDLRS